MDKKDENCGLRDAVSTGICTFKAHFADKLLFFRHFISLYIKYFLILYLHAHTILFVSKQVFTGKDEEDNL